MIGLSILDWCVIGVYFLILIGVVWWSSRKQASTKDYFLAGRSVGWFAIGASIFASNIGSEHLVGLAGQGASTGLAMAHWEMQAWMLVMLGWIFVPFYYRSGVFTMPEFLEKRFNRKARGILSIVSLLAYVLTKVSVTVYAGALVFQTLLPDAFGSPEKAFWIGAFATVVLTGIYTIFGGLRAVLYTDAAQAIILVIGSAFITVFGLDKLGGLGELKAICGQSAEQFALWRPLSDPDFPWLGVLIASPIIGFWYWCTDQYIVQRTLAAKNLPTARRSALFGGFMKVWPVLIFLIPGMIGYALHQKGLIHIPLGEDGTMRGDQVFPTMVTSLLPVGLRGLVVGGLLAALMSSLSSLFNSCASLFTVDIYEKIRPGRTEREYVTVGRMATGVVVGLGVLWIPVMKMVASGGLYQYLQSVQGYLAPPIAAVFLLGLFWKRINAHGAVWGLASGFLLGIGKLTVQTFFGTGKLENPEWLAYIGDYNFLYSTGWLFAISMVVITVLSLFTAPPSAEKTDDLTYSSIREKGGKLSEGVTSFDIGLSAVVIGLVVVMYLYFSFWL